MSKHPPWTQPVAETTPVLTVLNSLTSTKVPFVPRVGNEVGWYICGPTVYDSAHLGHARAYITFDILRRIMSNYFNYNVFYVMNITDIDDKIILRARRNHLFADYLKKADTLSLETIAQDIQSAYIAAKSKQSKKVEAARAALSSVCDASVKQMEHEEKLLLKMSENELKSLDFLNKHRNSKTSTDECKSDGNLLVSALETAKDVLSDKLDLEFGATVTDQAVFSAHSSRYESEFMTDMRDLGVLPPDATTRVSEYVPAIVDYVKKMVDNGSAYEANGSVYFSVSKFSETNNYAKLAPWAVGNTGLMEEGEGSLCSGVEKRAANDFVLWKKSKSGEPRWDSPWGPGRPGWHIECSVMASDLLGQSLDIHGGGEDLRFPHHDNEIAQCEAFHQCQQWVNYFLHAGHLHIDGLKMSKSLKNFFTIREILEEWSPESIRLLFLSQAWHEKMSFSASGLTEASAKEKQLREFFLNVKSILRSLKSSNVEKSEFWIDSDRSFHNSYTSKVEKIHKALLDNFDYPLASKYLFELVNETNKYCLLKTCKVLLINKAASYLDRMFRMFGVIDSDSLGFAVNSNSKAEDTLAPILDAFASFRSSIRSGAMGICKEKNIEEVSAKAQGLLRTCDSVRDDILPDLGVRLEDSSSGSVWKLDDPVRLKKERDEKRRMAQIEKIASLKSKLKAREADVEKTKNALVPSKELFTKQSHIYSSFNEAGLPLLDKDGKKLSNKEEKNTAAALKKQEELNKKMEDLFAKDPLYLEKQIAEVENIKAQLAKEESN